MRQFSGKMSWMNQQSHNNMERVTFWSSVPLPHVKYLQDFFCLSLPNKTPSSLILCHRLHALGYFSWLPQPNKLFFSRDFKQKIICTGRLVRSYFKLKGQTAFYKRKDCYPGVSTLGNWYPVEGRHFPRLMMQETKPVFYIKCLLFCSLLLSPSLGPSTRNIYLHCYSNTIRKCKCWSCICGTKNSIKMGKTVLNIETSSDGNSTS